MRPQKLTKIQSNQFKNQSDIIFRTYLKNLLGTILIHLFVFFNHELLEFTLIQILILSNFSNFKNAGIFVREI